MNYEFVTVVEKHNDYGLSSKMEKEARKRQGQMIHSIIPVSYFTDEKKAGQTSGVIMVFEQAN